MRRLIMLLLLVPLVSGQAIIEGEFVFTDEYNETYHFSMKSIASNQTCENTTIVEAVTGEEDPCENMSIMGVPSIIENGEKISYWFSPWQEGDSVNYWIEDARGEIVKSAYESASSSKKSYTANIEGEERTLFIKAERERTGCPLSAASVSVTVLGQAAACEEQEPEVIVQKCDFEESAYSLYVRARNHQENITLYGRAEEGEYWLFGEETPRIVSLSGEFSLTIRPSPGENTYGIVMARGGIPLTTSFNLTTPEAEEAALEEEGPAVNASYSFTPTGGIILEDGTGKNATIIAGLTGATGAGLLLSWLKAKRLRRKADSSAA